MNTKKPTEKPQKPKPKARRSLGRVNPATRAMVAQLIERDSQRRKL